MVKKKKMKTLLAASLSTVVLGSSYYNVKADDKTPLEKTLANAAVVDRLSESDEKKVTLITGDVVRVKKIENGKSVIDVDPADQNAAGVQVVTIGEDTYVIPNSATPYLAAGKLDKDLFNVTKLIENGYDDKSLSSLPVIVEYTEPTAGAVQTTRAVQTKKADPKGAKKVRVLESINGAALAESKKEAKTFWKDITPEASQKTKSNTKFDQGIEKIWLDGRVKATLAESVPQIGAPAAWESGFTGKGVKVAVLDTGVDPNHPDLKNQIDEVKSFVPGQTADDADGHGTHVASTVLGTGAASGGKYKGVAPEARLLVGKVLDNSGSGYDSWIIDGMEWAAHKAKIVSMSLGGGASDGTDPLSQAVNRLSEETGALFVIAAGNSGAEGTIASPGAADAALTIGAVDKADKIAYFSSKGPRKDMGLKPDLSAPGVGIVAAKSGLISGSGSYMSESGTSMATPHVAGAAAILLQKHPEWNGTQLKDALMSTSKRLDYSPYHIGSGRLDVQAAVFSRVRATGSLSFVSKWPNNNAQPVQKTVTYTNDSDSAVTLNLQADFKNADGKNAPEGMLTVSENKITVPANGTKTVTVTVDPKLADPVRYEGHLTATDSEGKQVAHTSIGMMKEKERYPLTFKATDRNGNPTNTGYLFIHNEEGQFQFVYGEGTTEILLPPGTYSAMSYMEVDTETDHSGVALVGNPEIKLDGPQTVELDARKAKEITVDVPKKAEPSFQYMKYDRTFVDGVPAYVGYLLFPWNDKMYAVPTKKVTTGKFEYSTRWRLIKPSLEINFKGKVLDDIPLPGSTLLDGKYNLSTVYAGKGTPADYERLKANGKAVVVDRNTEVTPSEQAAAAHTAGAKLLIIVNNEDKEFYWYVGNTTDWTDIPLAVAGISKSEGDGVIAAARSGNLNLFVEGEANPSYLYDLIDVHRDQIPNNLKYAPSNSELVKIDTRYKSDREAPGLEWRYEFRPNDMVGLSSRYLQKLPLPTVRTEWVSVDKDTRWAHKASVSDSSWDVFRPLVTYEKGQRLQEDWFSPVVRPRLSKGYAPRRIENDLGFNIPAWADSGNGSTGYVNNAESVKYQTLKLYQGDTLLQEEKGQILISNKPVPEEKTQYRLVSDAKRDPNRWKTSLSTHTEWAFWSQKGEESMALLPFYSLDYKVDTDMNGNAPAERPAKLELSVAKLESVAGYGKLEGATLEVSFNEGESWKTVNLERSADNKWVTKIKNPKNAEYVSLRATAWDDLGNKISQDIIKAYGLK
ncbi:peptidase [Bacillus sp. FJAT-25509]|uniref:S8 family peptidase n=1 Tax=Bacillus sp. FJAT-25509 TaxID=1712029 RepID=UPI000700C3C3|nr:S8 family serine peptidase [Bacillus sp. FJAT-25509]KQL42404.1 peptidase [Bacillus sp. FJAT-25509]